MSGGIDCGMWGWGCRDQPNIDDLLKTVDRKETNKKIHDLNAQINKEKQQLYCTPCHSTCHGVHNEKDVTLMQHCKNLP